MEQGYNLAKESGRDLEEGIACATAGLRRRFAARVWRDYYKHVDARRRYANPTDEGLVAQQRDRQIEEESRRRENEERVAQYNYFAARASNRSGRLKKGNRGQIRPQSPGSRTHCWPVARPRPLLRLLLLLKEEKKLFANLSMRDVVLCFGRGRHAWL